MLPKKWGMSKRSQKGNSTAMRENERSGDVGYLPLRISSTMCASAELREEMQLEAEERVSYACRATLCDEISALPNQT
jgi:hypothetical protein